MRNIIIHICFHNSIVIDRTILSVSFHFSWPSIHLVGAPPKKYLQFRVRVFSFFISICLLDANLCLSLYFIEKAKKNCSRRRRIRREEKKTKSLGMFSTWMPYRAWQTKRQTTEQTKNVEEKFNGKQCGTGGNEENLRCVCHFIHLLYNTIVRLECHIKYNRMWQKQINGTLEPIEKRTEARARRYTRIDSFARRVLDRSTLTALSVVCIA